MRISAGVLGRWYWEIFSQVASQENGAWDFPGGPVVNPRYFHCRGHGFDPWLGNYDPACSRAWPKIKEKKKKERKKVELVRVAANQSGY